MPMYYAIDATQQCVFIELHGVLTGWDVGTTAQRLWSEPGFSPYYLRLVDGSAISESAIDSILVQALAEDVRSNKAQKVALVANSDQSWKLLNEYRRSLKDIPAELFGSAEEAAEWLGVRLPRPWPPLRTVSAGAG